MSLDHKITNQLEDHEQKIIALQANQNSALILSSAIVELWLSDRSDHTNWSKYACGILCIVKKSNPKANFFQLLDLSANILWEQEIYTPFCYEVVSKNFHYFPAKDQNAGLNFAFASEADSVLELVGKFKTEQKKVSKPMQEVNPSSSNSPAKMGHMPKTRQEVNSSKFENKIQSDTSQSQKQKINRFNTILNNQKDKAKRFFSFRKSNPAVPKLEISSPNDFRVVQRVQITDDSIKIDAQDEQTKEKINEILSKLNVKSNQKTKQIVGDFLKKIEIDSESVQESIQDSEDEEKKYFRANAEENINGTNKSTRGSINRISIQPLVIQNNETQDSEKPKSMEAVANYVCNEPNMLDVLKSELEKRAQYLNQSDSEDFYSGEESDSEWI